MGTSNAAENRNLPVFRRSPFIGVEGPRDVPDLPTDGEAASSPSEVKAPDADSPHFIGPPPPPPSRAQSPRKAGVTLGLNWQSGLIGLGVIAVAAYGGLTLYQSRHIAGLAAVTTSPRPVLNSTTALNAPRNDPERPPQRQTAPLASSGVPATALPQVPAPAPSDAPATTPAAPAQGPVPAAPPRPSATDIVTENRKIVASPIMGDDQRQVLDLMAATNSVVLQLKRQLDEDTKQMRELQVQLDDMKRMVSLSQAKLLSAATEIAMGNIQPAAQAPPDSAPTPPSRAQSPDPQPVAARAPDSAPACRLKPSYVVASASPAHATLRGGNQVFISIRAPSRDNPQGDSLPCYGRILKITQEGRRWVIMTEHDVIGRN